jgi:hypothetical protein
MSCGQLFDLLRHLTDGTIIWSTDLIGLWNACVMVV